METIFDTVPKSDPLQFWSTQGAVDYSKVAKFLEFDANELSKLGGVSRKSVRTDSRAPKALRDRLIQIAVICTLVAEYFDGDEQKTALWFRTRNPMLGDVSPRDMIRYGRYRKLLSFVQRAREENETGA